MAQMNELELAIKDLGLQWVEYEGCLDWSTAGEYTWDFDTDEYYAVWTTVDRVRALYQDACTGIASEEDMGDRSFLNRVSVILEEFEAFNEVGLRDEEREARAKRFAALLDVPFKGFHSA